jgi:ATP-dependent DNA helicase RecQ
VLKGERQVRLRHDLERSHSGGGAKKARPVAADLDADALALFEKLRAWRASQAKEQGVPAYVVFGDATLKALATARPGSLGALGAVSGIGAAKLERYGEAVLALLAA